MFKLEPSTQPPRVLGSLFLQPLPLVPFRLQPGLVPFIRIRPLQHYSGPTCPASVTTIPIELFSCPSCYSIVPPCGVYPCSLHFTVLSPTSVKVVPLDWPWPAKRAVVERVGPSQKYYFHFEKGLTPKTTQRRQPRPADPFSVNLFFSVAIINPVNRVNRV